MAYLGVILLATLPPPVFDLTRAGILGRLEGALDPSFSGRDVVDAARNLLLFAGWGGVWVASAGRLASMEDGVRAVLGATIVGLLISVSVEGIQLLSPYRTTSLWDVMTNTAGSALGAGGLLALVAALRGARQDRSWVGLPAFVFAVGYGAAVVLEALIPLLGQGTIPGSGGGIGVRAGRALDHFSWATLRDLPLHHLVLFAPAGGLLVAALVERGMARGAAAGWVVGLALPVFAAIQVAGGVAGQPMVAGAVVVHVAAVALGAGLAVWGLPRFVRRFQGPARALLLLGVYLGLLALWSWRPFHFVSTLPELAQGVSLAQLQPLRAHAMRFDLFTVVDITRQFAILTPVGALLAVWPLRRRGFLRGPLPGIYAALFLEAGQILVIGRMFDMTDALVGAAAVMLGWVLVRRAGMRPLGELLALSGSVPPTPRSTSAGGRAPGKAT